MTTFRKCLGYAALVAPYLLVALIARNAYVGAFIALYAMLAAMITID